MLRFQLFKGLEQVWGQSDHPVAQKMIWRGKKGIFSYNMGIPIYFAIHPLTLSPAKFQLFGIGGSLGPF